TGAAKWFRGETMIGIALYCLLQQALLFVLVPNFVHRIWTAWTAVLAATFTMLDLGLYAFTPAVMTGVFLWGALREFELARFGAIARAGVYGLALAAVQVAVMHGGLLAEAFMRYRGHSYGFQLGEAGVWIGRFASLAVLLWAVIELLRREGLALSS